MALSKEAKREYQRRYMAQKREKRRAAAKVAQERPGAEREDWLRRLAALKEHVGYVGYHQGDQDERLEVLERLQRAYGAICEQLADQNALLRDQLRAVRAGHDALDARLGMAAKLLGAGEPRTLDEVLEDL